MGSQYYRSVFVWKVLVVLNDLWQGGGEGVRAAREEGEGKMIKMWAYGKDICAERPDRSCYRAGQYPSAFILYVLHFDCVGDTCCTQTQTWADTCYTHAHTRE